MADVILGLGTSHTPMLYTDASDWRHYEARDRKMELLDRDGSVRSYDELVERAGPEVSHAISTDGTRQNYDACQAYLDRLAEDVRAAELDAVVIIGDDQKELFQAENLPAILVYLGSTILNKKRDPKPGEPVWWSDALAKYYGDGRDELCPVQSELAHHIVTSLIEQEFDLAQSTKLPDGKGEGHAFAFIHSRILERRPIPVVPIFLNTYYPPNQPTPRRCYRLGQSLRRAVESFSHHARVAVIASGGLSHFVIDEELDNIVLAAVQSGDAVTLTSLPTAKLNSGTSEIRNWIAMYGACEHLTHEWTGYVPAYRTPAGTGTGCGFGAWK